MNRFGVCVHPWFSPAQEHLHFLLLAFQHLGVHFVFVLTASVALIDLPRYIFSRQLTLWFKGFDVPLWQYLPPVRHSAFYQELDALWKGCEEVLKLLLWHRLQRL